MDSEYDYCKSRMNIQGQGFEYTTEAGDTVYLCHQDLLNLSYFDEFTQSDWYIPWLKYKLKEKASG